MIIIGDQETAFPQLRDRLGRLNGLAKANPHIVAAILDAVLIGGAGGQVNSRARDLLEAKLWRALAYGEGPEVMVMDAPGARSHHLPGTNRIVLERSLVDRFEQAAPSSQAARFLGQEVLAVFLQSLVHWLCGQCFATGAPAPATFGAIADIRRAAMEDLRG